MKSEIYLIQENGELVELTQKDYDSEDLLQQFLEKYPKLIPGDQINELNPRKWILVAREAAIPDSEISGRRWSLDHLYLDQDGIPTLIEVKRSTDTRIRREVVGQMLDYAANAVTYWSVDTIKSLYEVRCEKESVDFEKTLESHLGPDCSYEEYWEKVKTNLDTGRLRLLFVADKIPYELKRIVEFLNEHMDKIEVLAVEIKQFVGKNQKTMVPRVIGQTLKTQEKKSGSAISKRSTWNREKFLDTISNNLNKHQADVLKEILDFCENNGSLKWGTGAIYGSFGLVCKKISDRTLFTIYTSGDVTINLGWLDDNEEMCTYRDKFRTLLKRDFPIKDDLRYPRFKPDELFGNKTAFIKAVGDLVNE